MEEHRKCGICYKAFDHDIQDSYVPICSVECPHALCRNCLVSIYLSRPNKKIHSIPCPFCKTAEAFSLDLAAPNLSFCSILKENATLKKELAECNGERDAKRRFIVVEEGDDNTKRRRIVVEKGASDATAINVDDVEDRNMPTQNLEGNEAGTIQDTLLALNASAKAKTEYIVAPGDAAKEIERLKEELAEKEKENANLRNNQDKLEAYTKRTLFRFNYKYLAALNECKVKLREKQDRIEALERRSASETTAPRRLLSSTTIYGAAIVQNHLKKRH